MYQALYRKYRPALLDDVLGQEIIVQTLKNAIKNNKLSHAYLFTGPRGTGKTSTAKILAKIINCKNVKNLEPCNNCDSCILINNKQSTDIIEIDAASNNGVDEIRELKSKINLVPSNSKYKVYIIDEVHMLSTGAFNALLKTLEEPPSHIIFILATTEPHKIPTTILSRCQRFDFKKISEQKIIENLKKIVEKEQIKIEEDALKEIAVLAQGGMRDSISLLDQAFSYCESNITSKDIHDINGTIEQIEMEQILKFLLNRNLTDLLKKIDELDSRGKNMIKLFEEFIIYLRNILICKTAPEYFEKNEILCYKEIVENIESDVLLKYIKDFLKTIFEMKNSDNEKITLELSLIEMTNLEKIQSKISDKNTQKLSEIGNVKEKVINNEMGKNNFLKNMISDEMIEQIKNIRINNTLNGFSKKKLMEYKNKISLINSLLLDEMYGQWVSLILDGSLKATGNGYLIFVYNDKTMELLFNQNWNAIESVFEKIYGEKMKVVATNSQDWEKIKKEFNSKMKIYDWMEEPSITNSFPKRNAQNNKIEAIFGDIIQYSE